ncbi:MAG TPA: M56 family metallopeptidase [Sediminibacterium sp.]|nr:M56 family metallopeptidase [Sediminibacterium sp.]
MTAYLVHSTFCLTILLLVYHFFFEEEKMHRFNRWYLLLSIAVSLLLPLARWEWQGDRLPELRQTVSAAVHVFIEQIPVNPTGNKFPVTVQGNTFPWLLAGYAIVTGLLFLRFLRNLYRLLRIVHSGKRTAYQDIQLVVLPGEAPSFSFGPYLFIAEKDLCGEAADTILTHEMAHIQQRHSLDNLLIELLLVIAWFHPVLYGYKKAIRLNHEFLADTAVLAKTPDVPAYQLLLLQIIAGSRLIPMTSSLHFSVTQKRFLMMSKPSNRKTILLKKLTLLPVTAIFILLIGVRVSLAQAMQSAKADKNAAVNKQLQEDAKQQLSNIVRSMQDAPFTEKGIGQEEMEEFNAIIRKHLYIGTKGNEKLSSVSEAERGRLQQLYFKMNRVQQASARIVFSKRSNPSKKMVPTEAQLEKWKNPADYGVWIDGEKVPNESLNKYRASDFSHYFASNLNYTPAMKENIRKKFNLPVMYQVQLNLMTNAGYDRYYKDAMALLQQHPYDMMFRVKADKTWFNLVN